LSPVGTGRPKRRSIRRTGRGRRKEREDRKELRKAETENDDQIEAEDAEDDGERVEDEEEEEEDDRLAAGAGMVVCGEVEATKQDAAAAVAPVRASVRKEDTASYS
jgi:hypothetical protein